MRGKSASLAPFRRKVTGFLRTVFYARVNHVGFDKISVFADRQLSLVVEGKHALELRLVRVQRTRVYRPFCFFYVEVQTRLLHPEVHAHAGLIPELLRRSSLPGNLPAPDISQIFTIQTVSPGVTVRQRLSSVPRARQDAVRPITRLQSHA